MAHPGFYAFTYQAFFQCDDASECRDKCSPGQAACIDVFSCRNQRDVEGVADVRVLGAIGVIEATEPFDEVDQAWLVDQGVWLRPFGRLLYTMPPFVTRADDIATVTNVMVSLVADRERRAVR